jgi:Dictyostelium (slime mold) repeat
MYAATPATITASASFTSTLSFGRLDFIGGSLKFRADSTCDYNGANLVSGSCFSCPLGNCTFGSAVPNNYMHYFNEVRLSIKTKPLAGTTYTASVPSPRIKEVLNDGDPCSIDACVSGNDATHLLLQEDNNACTVDACNSTTGVVTNTPVTMAIFAPMTCVRRRG